MIAGRRLRWIERTCWVAGISLFAVYFGVRIDGEMQRRQAVASFVASSPPARSAARVITAGRAERSNPRRAYREPGMAHWSRGRKNSYGRAAGFADRTPDLPVAILRIPSVDLEVPVYAVLDERNLNRGAALVKGTTPPDGTGNTAIAAHRDGYFRALEHVVLGDLLTVQTLSRLRKYRVTELEIVKPENTAPLRATALPVVTLVTCYPFYFVGGAPRRYIVRAVAMK